VQDRIAGARDGRRRALDALAAGFLIESDQHRPDHGCRDQEQPPAQGKPAEDRAWCKQSATTDGSYQ
jgi:hypothetical protein